MENVKLLQYLCGQDCSTITSITNAVKKKTGAAILVNETDMYLKGFSFDLNNEKFFIPEKNISFYEKHRGTVFRIQERMNAYSIPVIFHIGEGDQSRQVHEISQSPDPKFASNEWLLSNFSPFVAATYMQKHFAKSEALKEYSKIIFEAVEAFYLSMPHVAIMSLLPVFEAGLRNIQSIMVGTDPGSIGAENLYKGIKAIVKKWGAQSFSEYDHYPGKGYNGDVEIKFLMYANPQCDVIESFRSFFNEVIYKNSSANIDGFNRHMILHLLKNDFNERSNFVRLFLALTHITFIEGLNNPDVPLTWRGIDSDDEKLGNYFWELDTRFTHVKSEIFRITQSQS